MGKILKVFTAGIIAASAVASSVNAQNSLPRVEVNGSSIGGSWGTVYSSWGGGSLQRIDIPEAAEFFSGSVIIAANRFTPGCQREDLLLKSVKAAAESGVNFDSTVPNTLVQLDRFLASQFEDFTDLLGGGVVDDPKYQDPVWRKIKVIVEGVHYPTVVQRAAGEGGMLWIVEIHYWFNSKNNYVEQLKLKNSKSQGCVGQITTVS